MYELHVQKLDFYQISFGIMLVKHYDNHPQVHHFYRCYRSQLRLVCELYRCYGILSCFILELYLLKYHISLDLM